MLTRKVFAPDRGSYRITLPRAFVETLGIEAGDRLKVDLRDRKIILTPVADVRQDLTATGAATTTGRVIDIE